MITLISTTNRHVPIGQPSGYMFSYDLDHKKVLQKNTIIEVPYLSENPNPRGGMRGLKGFSIFKDRIAFVTSSTIFIYDNKWNPISYFFHPSCASIHELVLTEDKIWVTSTSADLLMCFDYSGKVLAILDVRKMDAVKKVTGWKIRPFLTDQQIQEGAIDFRDPRTHNLVDTDKAHINSVTVMKNGDLLVSLGLLKNADFSTMLAIKYKLVRWGIWQHFVNFNSFLRKSVFTKASETKGEMIIQPAKGYSVVVRINKELNVKPVLWFYGSSVPSHSARELADGSAIYLNSTDGELIHFDPNDGAILWRDKIGSKFLRGARELPDGSLLLGDGNSFYHYNLNARKVIGKYKFTDEEAPSVFDFCPLPNDFDIPPQSFQDHHDRLMPVHQI